MPIELCNYYGDVESERELTLPPYASYSEKANVSQDHVQLRGSNGDVVWHGVWYSSDLCVCQNGDMRWELAD